MFNLIEYGIVESFDGQAGSGFLRVLDKEGCRTGELIPIEMKYGRSVGVRLGRELPIFDRPHGQDFNVGTPIFGDRIVFVRGSGRTPTGYMCALWAHEIQWRAFTLIIRAWPRLRVVRTQNGVPVKVEWTSRYDGHRGVEELCEVYPRRADGGDELSKSYKGYPDDPPPHGLRIEAYTKVRAAHGRRAYWVPVRDVRPS